MTITSVSSTRPTDPSQSIEPQPIEPPSTSRAGARAEAAPIDLQSDRVEQPAVAPRQTARAARCEAVPTRESEAIPETRHLAQAFARGGLAGVRDWMSGNPEEARALLSMPRGELERGLAMALQSAASRPVYAAIAEAYQIVGSLADATRANLREGVRASVMDNIGRMRGELERSGDPHAREALEQLATLQRAVTGQAWSPEDFPGTMADVQRRSGLDCAREGSLAWEAFHRGSHTAERRASGISTWLGVAADMVDAARNGVTAAGLVVTFATNLASMALEAEINANHDERARTSQQRGL